MTYERYEPSRMECRRGGRPFPRTPSPVYRDSDVVVVSVLSLDLDTEVSGLRRIVTPTGGVRRDGVSVEPLVDFNPDGPLVVRLEELLTLSLPPRSCSDVDPPGNLYSHGLG